MSRWEGGDGAWILDAGISLDGRLLVTTSNDGTGRAWDLAARRPIGTALSGGSGDSFAAGSSAAAPIWQ